MKWALGFLLAAGGAGILVQATFRASGTGAVDRSAMAKLRDTVSVKDFGAVGDGVTDDTAGVAAARAIASGTGRILFFPLGVYMVNCGTGGALDFGTLPSPYAFVLRGEGQARSILKCRTAGTLLQFATQVGNNFSNGIEIADLGLTGFGSSDGTVAHGIVDNDVDNGTNNIYLHDLAISGFSGHGVFIRADFSIRLASVYVNDCGDNLFDIAGGNTTTLINTYAQTVAAGAAGYRIHNAATLISANGINNVWGGTSGTGLSEDQADWAVLGNEILTAWAQNTAYTVGQLRQANGLEFECITAGTSSLTGTGPAAVSKDITDGTAHWREIGQADSANTAAEVVCLNCNVEAFTRTGVRVKGGSAFHMIGGFFQPPGGSPGAGSAGLFPLWYSGAQDPQQSPGLIVGSPFANQSFTAYEHASPIHVTATTPAFVRLGGTTNNPLVWSRTSQIAASVPAITTVNNGATGTSLFYGTSISRLVVNGGPLTLTRVTPTYGTAITITPNLGNHFDITATDGVAFTVGNPNASPGGNAAGMVITLAIINTSGGPLGVATFGANYVLQTAWTQPATANRRYIQFQYNGTKWYELWRSVGDVAN